MMDKLLNLDKNMRIGSLLFGFFVFFILFLTTGNGFFIILYLFFIGLLIYSNILYAQKYSNIMEKSLDKAMIKNNFTSDYSYLSDDYLSGIAMNKSEKKIAIFKRNNIKEDFLPIYFDFKDIIECSIKEDNTIINRSVIGSAIGHAMVGGVLFGGIGAAVGGLSGEKIANEKIFKATLSIVIDDVVNPVHEIHFLNSNMLVDRNKPLYQEIYSQMDKWHKIISVIIKRNEKQSNSNSV
jgi:hypothetical protein